MYVIEIKRAWLDAYWGAFSGASLMLACWLVMVAIVGARGGFPGGVLPKWVICVLVTVVTLGAVFGGFVDFKVVP